MKRETGSSFIEVIVALALVGIIGVVFLNALTASSSTRLMADEQVSARILAESQMENIKRQTYAFAYDPVPVPPDYAGYVALVNIDNLRNGNIQKITVTVRHRNKNIMTLESYKANR